MNLNSGLELKDKLMTIGEVIGYLRNYLGEVSESKIRFYEKEGLIKPERTKGGHRLYCPEKVKRLRLILELRKKYRIPLEDIKKILSEMEKNDFTYFFLDEMARYSDLNLERIDINFLKKKLKLKDKEIEKLEKYGIIIKCPKTGKYYVESIRLIKLLKEIVGLGVNIKDINRIIKGIKVIADKEAGIVKKIVKGKEREFNLIDLKEKLMEFKDILYVLYLKRFFLEKGSIPEGIKRE